MRDKKNILFTIFDLHFGGISNLILHSVPTLMNDHNVWVIFFGKNEAMLERFEAAGIRVQRIKYEHPIHAFSAVPEIVKFVNHHQVQIIFTNLFIDKFLVAGAKLFSSFCLVSTLHSANNPYAEKLEWSVFIKKKLEELFHNYLVDINIAVSKSALAAWREFRAFKNDKVQIIYSGIPLEDDEEPAVIPEADKNKKYFLTACRLQSIKGLERLINVFSIVSQVNVHWELWILGDGPLMGQLKDQVHKLNLEKNIRFWGYQKDLRNYYISADFYINSSFNESLGISMLEALSFKIPILGSNVGGIPEIVSHSQNGFLIDFDDADVAADQILYCIQMDHEEYNRFSVNAFETFKTKFSVEIFAKELNYKILKNLN